LYCDTAPASHIALTTILLFKKFLHYSSPQYKNENRLEQQQDVVLPLQPEAACPPKSAEVLHDSLDDETLVHMDSVTLPHVAAAVGADGSGKLRSTVFDRSSHHVTMTVAATTTTKASTAVASTTSSNSNDATTKIEAQQSLVLRNSKRAASSLTADTDKDNVARGKKPKV
jgi:hypothetical protein